MPPTAVHAWTEELSLADLRAGETALVARIDSSSATFCEMLGSRGLTPGAPVTVVRSSDPLVVSCGCSRWGIARSEACRIGVARLPGLADGRAAARPASATRASGTAQ